MKERVDFIPKEGTSMFLFLNSLWWGFFQIKSPSFLVETLSPETAFEPGNERTQDNKGHRGLCDDNRKSSRKKREWRWRMCAREGLGREGMPGPEREEGEGVLEVAVVSRDGTDRQRADWRARPLTFPEHHVPAAAGCESRPGWSVLSPAAPGTPLSLRGRTRPLQPPPGILQTALAQRRAGKKIDTTG